MLRVFYFYRSGLKKDRKSCVTISFSKDLHVHYRDAEIASIAPKDISRKNKISEAHGSFMKNMHRES